MMKSIQRVALLLAIVLFPHLVVAEEISDDSFEQLMELSGLNKQMAELPGVVLAGIEQAMQQRPLPDSLADLFTESVSIAYQPSLLLSAIAIEVRSSLSESEAKDLLVWYESDLGKKITRVEEESSTAKAYQEMMQNAQSLLSNEQHVKYALKMDSIVNGTEMGVQIQMNSALAMVTGMSAVMSPDKPIEIESIKKLLSAQEPQIRANMQQLVILSSVNSYQYLDQASIETYITHLDRPVTRKFSDSANRGIMIGLEQAVTKMSETLAASLKDVVRKDTE